MGVVVFNEAMDGTVVGACHRGVGDSCSMAVLMSGTRYCVISIETLDWAGKANRR